MAPSGALPCGRVFLQCIMGHQHYSLSIVGVWGNFPQFLLFHPIINASSCWFSISLSCCWMHGCKQAIRALCVSETGQWILLHLRNYDSDGGSQVGSSDPERTEGPWMLWAVNETGWMWQAFSDQLHTVEGAAGPVKGAPSGGSRSGYRSGMTGRGCGHTGSDQ